MVLFPLFAVERRSRLRSKFLVTIHAKARVQRQSLCLFATTARGQQRCSGGGSTAQFDVGDSGQDAGILTDVVWGREG